MLIHSFIDNSVYQSDSQFIKYNPYNLEKLHEVNSCDLMGLIRAIQSSHKAFQEWKNSTLIERQTLIQKIQNELLVNKDHYAKLEALDQALSVSTVKKHCLESVIKNIQNLVEIKNVTTEFQFTPVGVIVIVASWNLSLRVILDRLVPALLAGNAVIVKVSSASPVTAIILSEIVNKCEIPKGLINVIVTDDIEVKRALLAHPGVKAVSFTGCLETTNEILPLLTQASLQNFKKIQISSGSKNSGVCLSEPTDANFKEIMDSFLIGQGQLVWNSARLFVLEKYETQWQERIQDYMNTLRPSDGIEDESVWTPCLKPKSFNKFEEIKNQSKEDQAHLIEVASTLTEKQKKIFLPPIFTKDMSRCSTLQQDQIHSPFFILSSVKYPFDVPKYSNVSYFGFAAHLWGEHEKLNTLATALDVGLVTFNKSSVEVCGSTIGVKQSGFGLQDNQSFGAFFSNVKRMS